MELDRRKVRDRITELQKELEGMGQERGTQRARRREREGLARVALVGYTNAGKSTLMRALTGSEVLVANKLFATLDTTVRALYPESVPRILVSDTVGFIKNLPHGLVASFKSTLDEALEASLLLQAASRLQAVQENWNSDIPAGAKAKLDDALLYNRKLWSVFVSDMAACLDVLASRTNVDATRIGAVGYCMGVATRSSRRRAFPSDCVRRRRSTRAASLRPTRRARTSSRARRRRACTSASRRTTPSSRRSRQRRSGRRSPRSASATRSSTTMRATDGP